MKFLIVDDDERMILLLGKFLSEYAQCVTAHDGPRAIELFQDGLDRADPFAAVFMDFMMPGINGVETGKILRAREKAHGLDGPQSFKLFMVSGKCDMKIVSEAFFKCNAEAYLVKPFSRDDLRRLLVETKIIAKDAAGELTPSPWTNAEHVRGGAAPSDSPAGGNDSPRSPSTESV
ncbi:MAG: response regulator [Desulfovibrionaceae bacterium]|nr:response regulator [Desulfovibrionaceae bacterium]MBF0513426.1 response regulator [Desulfovibrionaceae bacterium]